MEYVIMVGFAFLGSAIAVVLMTMIALLLEKWGKQ